VTLSVLSVALLGLSSHRQEGRVTIGDRILTIRVWVWVWAQEGVSSEEKGRKRSVKSRIEAL